MSYQLKRGTVSGKVSRSRAGGSFLQEYSPEKSGERKMVQGKLLCKEEVVSAGLYIQPDSMGSPEV